MKINKLYIKNLNSLKGEHVIDFDAYPLNQNNLFLISGPTGAGKSTILDAISLALFNEIPRLGKISKTSVEVLGAVMTHNTDEAVAELDYTVKNVKYRSRWSIHKTKTGSLSDYTMELTNLSQNEIFPIKKGAVPAENERIIQLNSAQFLQSILLSQGEFAQFLKADPKDRTVLLEKLTGTTIYRELGKLAYEQNKLVSRQYDEKKAEIEHISLLSDAEIVDFNETLTLNKDILITENEQHKKKLSYYEKSKSYTTISIALYEKQNSLEEASEAYRLLTPQLLRLEQHQKLNPYRETLTRYDETIQAIHKANNDLANEQRALDVANHAVYAALQEYTALVKEKVDLDSFLSHIKQYEADYLNKLSALHQKKELGIQQKNVFDTKVAKINDVDLKRTLLDKSSNDIVLIIDRVLAELEGKRMVLSKYSYLIDLPYFQDQNQALNAKKTKFEEQINQLNIIKNQFDYCNKISLEINTLQEGLNANEVLLKSDHERLATLNTELLNVTAQYNDLKNREPLVGIVSQLQMGDECPICGNTIVQLHQHDLAQLGALDIFKTKLEKDANVITQSIQSKTTKMESSATLLEDKLQQLESARSSIPTQYTNSAIISEEISSVHDAIEETKQSIEELNLSFKLSENQKVLEELRAEAENLERLRKEFKLLDDAFKVSYQGKNIQHITNQLQEIINIAQVSQHKCIGSISTIQLNLTTSKKTLDQLVSTLQEAVQKLNFGSIEEAKSCLLSDFEYRKIEQQKTNVSAQINTLNSEIALMRSQLMQLQDDAQQFDLHLLESEIHALGQSIESLNRTIGSIEEKLKKNDEQATKKKLLEQQLVNLDRNNKKWRLLSMSIGSAEGDKFAHFAQTLTLKYLLSYANARLHSLTDRYLLILPESIKSDLEVLDTYQGNMRRTVKTLSGGETFIVSLALALSLSDLASRNNPIDCLFIDEGFGTLDPETLEVAMNTLDNLQYQTQKQIGIISHVSSLKERISTQILLKRDGFGYSRFDFK